MTVETRSEHALDIGATSDLNLRVSAANLVKVYFNQPLDQQTKLVLERTATVRASHGRYTASVRAKPFGGGLRINGPGVLRTEVGEFNFDSYRSHVEKDFRIFINPTNWDSLKQFCWQHLREPSEVLESSPRRELVEEFRDALKTDIKPEQYHMKWSKIVVEDDPIRTGSPRSIGSLTTRIYSIHEMQVLDADIIADLIESSTSRSNQDLREEAERDYQKGGRGRANAVLALDYENLVEVFNKLPKAPNHGITRVWGNDLESNVLALIDEVESNKYQDLSFDCFE